MTTTLVDTTFSGKNISSPISVYEYVVLTACTLRIQVRLAAVAGGGDYIAYLTLNDGDAQTDDVIAPKTTYTAGAGETSFWFSSMSLDVLAGDVINIFIDGLAGDTNESGSIRIFSDNYTVEGNGGTLSLLYIVTSGGLPVQGATVELYPTSAYSGIIDSQVTDVLGHVTFNNLVAGTYYLKVIRSGYTTALDSEAVS